VVGEKRSNRGSQGSRTTALLTLKAQEQEYDGRNMTGDQNQKDQYPKNLRLILARILQKRLQTGALLKYLRAMVQNLRNMKTTSRWVLNPKFCTNNARDEAVWC